MRLFTAVSWNWVTSKVREATRPSRRRFGRTAELRVTAVSAEVEHLESRALLTVTYHGGALLASVEAQAVYLGSDWKTNSSLTTQTGQIDTYVSTIVDSPYMDMLKNAGYNVGRGSASAGAIDNVTLSKVTSVGVTDKQIRQELQTLITAGSVQVPDANRLYIVYVEPGVVVRMGTGASNSTFLGYHGAFAGKSAAGAAVDVRYAVIPYPGTPNISPQSQGFASAFDEQTAVTSHELAEAVTDPDVNYKSLGWYDDRYNGEIADLTRLTTRMGDYLVQDVVDKNDKVITPVTTVTTTDVGTPNLTATAASSTAVKLTWNAVAGSPTGYRIFQTIGSTTTTISVSSTTTAYTVSGLTAGSTVSFQVEAYNATSKADSSTVTVTLPKDTTTTTLGTPTLTVTALSPYSAQLTWTGVDGATGYIIYYISGGRWRRLGVVGSGVTSVQVVGLQPNSTYQFAIGAYNSKTESDSDIVSITMPDRRYR
ncbi:MAG: fibronectin type III domain-containing protein [Planctomycetes bacterium]|nr:fibronectin type III domain-containing protein [Planctomycetota bacterium]